MVTVKLKVIHQKAFSVTYIDEAKGEWYMLMPDAVREAFAPCYEDYLQMAEAGTKLPSKKQLRMMAFLSQFMEK